jgi:hypothetical protein
MGQVVSAIIIVLVIAVGASIVLLSSNRNASTVATTSSCTLGSTSDCALLAQCPGRQSSGFGFGFVATGPVSPAVICVQLYYYNSVAPQTLNLTDVLSIQAAQYIPNGSVDYPRSFDGAPNFTISTSQAQMVIGGPSNANEGTTVAFAVNFKPGASGIYELGLFSSEGLNAYMLGAKEPESCGVYGQILAGSSSRPNYAQEQVGCVTYNTSSSGSITASGIPYPLTPGIYFRILGVTNSSGIEVLP